MKKLLILIFSLFIFQNICFALPNPKSWEAYANISKIKEVAIVTHIKIDQRKDNVIYQTVTFQTQNKTFTGKCITESKNSDTKNRIIGGIYFNPQVGDLVYVTITNNNGQITTYQPITKEQARLYKANPDKIRYNLGKAYIED